MPLGSDESDCTPGILSMCVRVRVCACLSVYHSGNGGPPAITHILIRVFCIMRSECVCFNVCVFLCMLCLITEDGVVGSLFQCSSLALAVIQVVKNTSTDMKELSR